MQVRALRSLSVKIASALLFFLMAGACRVNPKGIVSDASAGDAGDTRAPVDGNGGGDRPVGSDGPAAEVPVGGGPGTNGEACSVPADCATGACVDGICCESACTGDCE